MYPSEIVIDSWGKLTCCDNLGLPLGFMNGNGYLK